MFEGKRAAGIGKLMADEYTDRWGYDRQSLVDDARRAFFHLHQLTVKASDVVIARGGDEATVTALIRLEASGTARAAEARATINGLYSPFTFAWRREKDFPWRWRLVSIDHEHFQPRRLRGSRGRIGFQGRWDFAMNGCSS